MVAYYNEFDPDAAATLRELIADGLIADGVVDERSIELVQPSDIRGFTQVHLFAGFGIWSLAARLAGWRDDRPLWTASCPCPPFSSAGKVKACPGCGGFKPIPHVRRTGAFLCSLCGHEWLADQRHLWPEVWRLVRDGRPPCVMGEQVASADGRTWLDLVRASLEILAYDAWGVDTCAAGFGAPHIRQRLYWVADAEDADWRGRERGTQTGIGSDEQRGRGLASGGADRRLVDSFVPRLERHARDGDDGDQPGRVRTDAPRPAAATGPSGGVGDALGGGRRAGRDNHAEHDRHQPDPIHQIASFGMANLYGDGRREAGNDQGAAGDDGSGRNSPAHIERPGPTNGLWRDPDWLGCTDGRWRPVESGTFPLAPAGAFRRRVPILRGAGNAINLAQAAEFIAAVMPELPGA